jgi:predicted ATPase
VLSEVTARLVQGEVRTEACGPVSLTAQATPIPAYKVREIVTPHGLVAQHGSRPLTRFVGRDRELAALHALLAQVAEGQGHIIGVVGEPGMGKSRLVYEFRRSVPEQAVTYVAGHCVSYGTATPYLPVVDLLQSYCSLRRTDPPDTIMATLYRCLQEVGMVPDAWAPYLLHLLGGQADTARFAALSPQALKARTSEALLGLLINGSRQRPLVLEIENAHWIDATSEAWLGSLVERMAGAPLLLLVTYRPGYRLPWVEKSFVTQLSLTPLGPDDGRWVIRGILHPGQISPALEQQILARARGNPFFLEELARSVAEQEARHLDLTVPHTVQAVLAARTDRLPAAARRLLQRAAVIGGEAIEVLAVHAVFKVGAGGSPCQGLVGCQRQPVEPQLEQGITAETVGRIGLGRAGSPLVDSLSPRGPVEDARWRTAVVWHA